MLQALHLPFKFIDQIFQWLVGTLFEDMDDSLLDFIV